MQAAAKGKAPAQAAAKAKTSELQALASPVKKGVSPVPSRSGSGKFEGKGEEKAQAGHGDQPARKRGIGLAGKFAIPILTLLVVALTAWGMMVEMYLQGIANNHVKKNGVNTIQALSVLGAQVLTAREENPAAWPITMGFMTQRHFAMTFGNDLEKKILELGFEKASDVYKLLDKFEINHEVIKKNNINSPEFLAKRLGFASVQEAQNGLNNINSKEKPKTAATEQTGTLINSADLAGIVVSKPTEPKAQAQQAPAYRGLAEMPLSYLKGDDALASQVQIWAQDAALLSNLLNVAVKDSKSLANTEVLDAYIGYYTGTGGTDLKGITTLQLLIGARPQKQGNLSIDQTGDPESSVNFTGSEVALGGITIESSSITRAGQLERIKNFSKDIVVNGKVAGKILVCISAKRIEEEQSSIGNRMMILGAFVLILVAGLALWISAMVTAPVQTLIKDMEIVSHGDLNHTTKAHSSDEIGAIAHQFNTMTQKLLVAHQAEKEAERLESELDMAREIQVKLLPAKVPHIRGLDIHAVYHPAKEVGGDYYDFFPVDKEHIGMIVADVSGKGIPGSMVMATTRTILRFVAAGNLSAADTLARTNAIVAADIRRGMFVTAIYLVLDARTYEMNVSSAGHNPMAIYRARTGEVELINPSGIALGFDKGPLFQRTIKQQPVPLEKGDRVVMYTDGVVEAMDIDNQEYTDTRFFEFVKKNAGMRSKDFVDTLLADLDQHKGEAEQHDDITVVTFRLE